MVILTDSNDKFINISGLTDIDNGFISIKFPLWWIQHVSNCISCNGFYRKLLNKDISDWFVIVGEGDNTEYYKIDLLDNKHIGNGVDNVISSNDIDIIDSNINSLHINNFFNIENIQLIKVDNIIERDLKISLCLDRQDTVVDIDNYTNDFFTEIPKEIAEKFINHPSTIVLEPTNMSLKIEIKKND